MKKVTALLPMKDHSERVPHKNIRNFADKPLYHCIAKVLEDSDLIDQIIINTDSDRIAEDAVKSFSKVKIIWRPEKIRGDMVSMNDIIAYDIDQCENEHFLQTHSTNPLLSRETIDKSVVEYFNSLNQHDSLFSVTRMQVRLYWESGEPINHNPIELLRTQDLTPVYEENSNIYLFSKQSFVEAGNKRIGKKPKMFAMNQLEAIDIDEEADFKIAEILYRMRKNED